MKNINLPSLKFIKKKKLKNLTKLAVDAFLFFLFAIIAVYAARLPVVGGDTGQWGAILNEYFNITFTENGSLKNNTVGTFQLNDSVIVSSKIAEQAVNASHIESTAIISRHINNSAVNSTHILNDSITGSDINVSTNITINTLNATLFDFGIEKQVAECSGVGCTATANCSSGKKVIFGMGGDNLLTCDTIPLNCNNYCTILNTSCSITSTITGASVYIVCAKIT